jgi:uncharacterized protein
MDFNLIASNFISVPVLFFFLGMLVVLLKSDLEIPQPLPKLFSIYLLFAIGLKGGSELSTNPLSADLFYALGGSIIMAILVPVLAFFILRTKLDIYNAAALAASYGSVSVVTFIAASTFLKKMDIHYDGFMVAMLAIMESPAIVIGILFVRLKDTKTEKSHFSLTEVLREAFLNGSVFLLIGSVVIGMLTGEKGNHELAPFTRDIFLGILSLFLLDMGIISARRIRDLKKVGVFIMAFSMLLPVFNALLGILFAHFVGMTTGNAFMFSILCASASYIAVPAAIRTAIPEANPGYYVPLPLGITFPFNIIIGIPLYYHIIQFIWA